MGSIIDKAGDLVGGWTKKWGGKVSEEVVESGAHASTMEIKNVPRHLSEQVKDVDAWKYINADSSPKCIA